MALRLNLSETQVTVRRSSANVIAAGFGLGAVAIGFGLLFAGLGRTSADAPHLFIVLFASAFVAAGLAALWQTASRARVWIAAGGVDVLRCDQAGVELCEFPGSTPFCAAWDRVVEVVVARRLEIVEVDETVWAGPHVIVFLTPETADGFWARAKARLSRSGNGRIYASVAISMGITGELTAAIRRFAPGSVPVTPVGLVRMDTRQRTDTFDGKAEPV